MANGSSSRGRRSRHSHEAGSSARARGGGGFFRFVPNAPPKEKKVRLRVRVRRRLGSRVGSRLLMRLQHLNPNRIPVPVPSVREVLLRAIIDRREALRPELGALPRYDLDSPYSGEVFESPHDLHRRAFFAMKPPDACRRAEGSPVNSDDSDAAHSDSEMYVRLPEERFPVPSIPLYPRPAGSPAPLIIKAEEVESYFGPTASH